MDMEVFRAVIPIISEENASELQRTADIVQGAQGISEMLHHLVRDTNLMP